MANFNLNDYIDVQTRINRFWTEYPDGAIRTQHASDPADFETCRYRAEVYKDRTSPAPDAVGYAFERAGSGMANKTSHEENCETSAIGRALANMGYATSGKDRPSRQEMTKAQRPAPPPSEIPGDVPLHSVQDFSGDDQWQKANASLHVTAGDRVGSQDAHDVVHLMATIAGFPSVKAVPVKRLVQMRDFIKGPKWPEYYAAEIESRLADIKLAKDSQ
jgi:hypothetical protein